MIERQGCVNIVNIVEEMEELQILLLADTFWIFFKPININIQLCSNVKS